MDLPWLLRDHLWPVLEGTGLRRNGQSGLLQNLAHTHFNIKHSPQSVGIFRYFKFHWRWEGRLRKTYLNLDEPLLGKSWSLRQPEISVHNTAGRWIGWGQSGEVPSGFFIVLILEMGFRKITKTEKNQKILVFHKNVYIYVNKSKNALKNL